MKMKLRHSWGKEEKTFFTVQQQCVKCKLVRFKALGIWMYCEKKISITNPLPDAIPNKGCIN